MNGTNFERMNLGSFNASQTAVTNPVLADGKIIFDTEVEKEVGIKKGDTRQLMGIKRGCSNRIQTHRIYLGVRGIHH